MGLGAVVRKLTSIRQTPNQMTVGQRPAGASTVSSQPQAGTSVFASAQALTFPVAVVLIGGGWSALQLLTNPWMHTLWVPLLLSLLVGAIITFPSVSEEAAGNAARSGRAFIWFRGIVIGTLNSLVLFGAIAGARATVSQPASLHTDASTTIIGAQPTSSLGSHLTPKLMDPS